MIRRGYPRVLCFVLVFMMALVGGDWQPAEAQAGGAVYLPLVIREEVPTFLPPGEVCECVKYVVRYLFDEESLPGDWPTAESMASDSYWGREQADFHFRTPFPRREDVIIFQDDAWFEVLRTKDPNAGEWEWVTVDDNDGYPEGHIGIIVSVYDEYPDSWRMEIISANWPNEWIIDKHTEEYCNNVGYSSIRVPKSELGISFWSKGPFFIGNYNSGKYIDIPSWSLDDGPLWQFDLTEGDNQLWYIRNFWNTNFEYPFMSGWSGKCVDVNGASTLPGAQILQYTCHLGDNQWWRLQPTGSASYYIISKSSGLCLDVEGGSQENGGYLIQNTCNGFVSQKWFLR